MIAFIAATGLGRLHTRLDLPEGDCEILGESEAGKSLLVETVCATVFGRASDGGAVDPGLLAGERADLAIGFTWGDTLRRPVTAKGIGGATLISDGAEARYASQAALAAALGDDLGGRAWLCRHLVVPMAWRDLPASGKGSLAELVRSVLPPADLRAEVARLMGEAKAEMRPTDPLDEKSAVEARRLANSAQDAAAGRLDEARRALADIGDAPVQTWGADVVEWSRAILGDRDAWAAYGAAGDARATRDATIAALRQRMAATAPTIDADRVREADEVLGARDEWVRHDRALETHRAEATRHAEAVRRRDEVRARRAELGERPAVDLVALTAKRSQVARVDTKPFEQAVAEKAGLLAAAETKLKELSGKGDDCPTCGQPWAARAAARDAAVSARDAAKAEHDRATKALTKTTASLDALKAEIAVLEQADAALRAWEMRSRDIGQEPAVAVAPVAPVAPRTERPAEDRIAWASGVKREAVEVSGATKRHDADVSAARTGLARLEAEPLTGPAEPEAARPSDEDVVEAERVLRDVAAAEGATAERARVRAERERTVAARTTEAQRATAEAARLDVLVGCVRRAPGDIARRQAAALGPMGPASLVWDDAGGVDVLVDGRPWRRASTGRRILACLCVRAALARAAGLDWLTLFVDEAQSWSGAWPDVGVRVVRLRTAKGALRVVGIGREAA